MKGALDEAMEIMKGSLADNSQVEQPYRTKGIIDLNDAGNILNITVKGILVDFNVRQYISGIRPSDKDIESAGWRIDNDTKEVFIPDFVSSRDWEEYHREQKEFVF